MKSIKKYLITFGAGLLAVALIIWFKDIFSQTELVKIFHILCDGFFVVGVVMTGFGLLIFTSNEGAFDGLAFAVSSFINIFRRNLDKRYDTLYDYKESRANKKVGFGFLLISGVVFIAVSMIMLLLYYKYNV